MSDRLDPELLERWLAGECNADEARRVAAHTAADPELQLQLRALREEFAIPPGDVDAAWQAAAARLPSSSPPLTLPRTRHRAWSRTRIAATAAFACAAALVLIVSYNALPARTRTWAEVEAPRGQRAEATLPDGSRVLLSAGSNLRYQQPFGGRRDVVLEGEAFFEVARDPRREFRVRAQHGLITVLGTRFGVRAFAGDSVVQVAVREGLVAVSDTANAGRRPWSRRPALPDRRVSADQVAVLHGQGLVQIVSTHTVAQTLAWMNDEFVFRDAPLGDIARELARLYDVEVSIASDIAARRFTGTLRRQPLDDLMHSIAITTDIAFEIDADSVFMMPKRRNAPR